MVTREELFDKIAAGVSYEVAARELDIPPGQAYLVATGLPADGSDSLAPDERDRPSISRGSTQAIVNPPTVRPGSTATALSFLKARAAADAGMRDAARRRNAAPPEPVLPEDREVRDDILEILRRDHNQARYLMEQLETLPTGEESAEADLSRRRSLLDMLVVALAGHEAAEKAEFWPLVSKALSDGGEQAGQATEQEQQGKELLEQLEDLSPDDEKFDELLQHVLLQLRRHVAFEERVFLAIEHAVDPAERARVGRRTLRLKRLAPTRPHAKAGSGRRAALAGPLLGVIDRTKDSLKGRPADRLGQSEEDLARESV